jgi:hypothetical protein
MRRLLALSLALLAMASASLAQPRSEALEEARTLMGKAGMDALTWQVARVTMQHQRTALQQANPGRTEAVAEVMKLIEAELAKRLPGIMDAYSRIYTLHFTLEELRQLNAFYDTPLGRKLIRETPAISAEAMAMNQAFGQQVMVDVMRAMQPELDRRKLAGPGKT